MNLVWDFSQVKVEVVEDSSKTIAMEVVEYSSENIWIEVIAYFFEGADEKRYRGQNSN